MVPEPAGILPPPLVPGDIIGLFSPAGPVRDKARLRSGLTCIEEMGYRPILVDPKEVVSDPARYLAADDHHRADELQALWADPQVKALLAVRGGYGCLRIADRLDYSLLSAQSKWLIGFSDLTVLLAALHSRCGLIGLHAPVLTSLGHSDKASVKRMRMLLSGVMEPYRVHGQVRVIRDGTATGRIIVGNLTTLVHLIATPWEPDYTDALLVLEDTGESLYRVDRLLTHLAASGRLDNLAGLILGSFDNGAGRDPRLEQGIHTRAAELTRDCGCPVWGNFPVGHLAENYAVPFGMNGVMDSERCLLELLPPGN